MAAPMWMWKSSVENYIDGISDNDVSDVVTGLLGGTCKLVDFVEDLGSYLTNSDVSVRARSTRLLADVLHNIPTDFLSNMQVELLVTYMLDKLKDHHSVQPHAIYGLRSLSCCLNLPVGVTRTICQTIFKEVYNQSLSQGDRHNVYQIMHTFLNMRLEEVRPVEGEFVHGFIQLMDMEKDPRNLVLCFKCVRTICQNLSLGVFLEEMFEVVSCYFPVDFSPPPNDEYGVKKEDLEIGLRDCMSSTPKFAPHCLPLLLEKLTSDLSSAKLDSFLTLIACADVYGAEGLREFLGSLFSCIKREVFLSGEEKLEECALNALTATVRTLSKSIIELIVIMLLVPNQQKGSKTSLDGFLDEVIKECKCNLDDPGVRQFAPTGRIFQAMAGSSDPAYCTLVHVVVPTLLEQFHNHTQAIQRIAILNVLQNFIRLSQNFTYSQDVPCPLLQYKDQMLPILYGVLSDSNVDLRRYGVTSLTTTLSCPGLLIQTDHDLIADRLCNLVFTDQDKTVREGSIAGLSQLGSVSSGTITDRVLPVLVEKLSCQSEPMDVEGQRPQLTQQNLSLQTMVAIATHQDIIVKVVPQILARLQSLTEATCTAAKTELAETASMCVCNVLQRNVSSDSVVQYYYKVTVPELIHVTVESSLQPDSPSVLHSERVIVNISRTLRITTSRLSPSDSSDLCSSVLNMCFEGFVSQLGQGDTSSIKTFQPLEASSPWQQTQLISLMMAVICSMSKEVRLKQEAELMDKLMGLSLDSGHLFTRTMAAMCLAGLVNKLPQGDSLLSLVQKLKGKLSEVLKSKLENSDKERRALVQLTWLAKALILRGHPLAGEFTNQILDLFEDSSLGFTAAEGFYILLNEYGEVLNASQHANVRLMYRQRLFLENLPKLVHGFNNTQSEKKRYYLTALSHLLNFVPKQVLLTELPNLIPLLVQSLLCEDPGLQLSTVSTLSGQMSENPDIFSTHVDSLVLRLLKLSCHSADMRVRISSLQCLSALTGLSPHVILPHQKAVIRGLESALDDRKRLVRKEAVKARGEWFLLGAPTK